MRKVLSLCLFLACFGADAHISIEGATVRMLPPGVPNTAAYFTITNDTNHDIYLVDARTVIAKTAELHNHIVRGEVMKMEKQSKVKVAAGQQVQFQPGGLHVMLFGLNRSLKEGQTVALTLITEKGTEIDFTAKAVMPGQESSHKHHHH